MRVSTDLFTHDKLQKTFTIESSSLQHGWIDGITLISPRGNAASFFLKERTDDKDGDVTHWTFTCSTNPKVAGYKMVIFND